MKLKFAVITSTIMILVFVANAQIIDPKEEAKSQGTNRTNQKIEEGIDSGFDKVEEGIGNLFKKKDKKKKDKSKTSNNESGNDQDSESNEKTLDQLKPSAPDVQWSKYDFVSGDEIIFTDGPDNMEENGEFPSRWDYVEGSAEIAEMNGETVIIFLDGGGAIIPFLKNSKEDYLPEVFTIEFDAYFQPGESYSRYWITFQDNKNQWDKGLNESMEIYVNGIDFLSTDKKYPGTENYNWGVNPIGGWKHIAIAYTKGKLKAYMDDTRLVNIPHLEGNPTGITIKAEKGNMFIKNTRIAKGGVKYYDRVMSDGKIITNGIHFDINKATLKPESMGPINKIYNLMQKQSDLKFSIEGHTDSDGEVDSNQKLSEKRAETVMKKLIEMGINKNRLKSKGFGESMPLDNGTTAESKANNRRVEFVKF